MVTKKKMVNVTMIAEIDKQGNVSKGYRVTPAKGSTITPADLLGITDPKKKEKKK